MKELFEAALKNFLYANAVVTSIVSGVATINVLFAWEGHSVIPPYAWNLIRLMLLEGAFWVLAGIVYVVYLICKYKRNRRMGILRYDGQRGEWYYQR